MAKIVRDIWGGVFYKNDTGMLHRKDGPAIIVNGNLEWWYEGVHTLSFNRNGVYIKYLREGNAVLANPNGITKWFRDGFYIWPTLG